MVNVPLFVIIGILPMFSGGIEFKPELLTEKENFPKSSSKINLEKLADGTLSLDLKKSLNIDSSSTVVIMPYFTAFAYDEQGFYDYFRNECSEECLTVQLSSNVALGNESSANGFYIFNSIIGFDYMTDLEVHNNPSILNSYDKVILLHNEYVTKTEFDAITNHPNVVYMYPNALYAEIIYDESKNSISLIRGHGYPTPEIVNGLDWKFDNTHPYEYDTECNDWEFYSIDNGYMLNCYPEKRLSYDVELIKTILEL